MTATSDRWPLPGDPDASVGARHHRVRDASRPPGHDHGIAYADEIWFPLDPRRLLILGRPGDPLPEQFLYPPAETAATFNLAIAAGAYEQLPKPGPILQVHGQLPFDPGCYNQPVTDTRTQRRR